MLIASTYYHLWKMLSIEDNNKIISYVGKQGYEVEFRFGHYNVNKYANGITRGEYYRLLEVFLANYFKLRLKVDKSTSTISISGNHRKYSDGTAEYYFTKDKVWVHELEEYPIKLAIYRETIIQPPTNFKVKFTRQRQRYSFLLKNGTLRLDITNVKNKGKQKYEVELEILQPTTDYINVVLELYKIIKGTTILYNLKEYKATIDMIANSGGFNSIQPLTLAQLNLMLRNRDLVHVMCRYPEGKRYYLVFNYIGIWLVSTNLLEANLIFRGTDKNYAGYILDGVLCTKKYNGKLWYLALDCIRAPLLGQYGQDGSNHVQELPYRSRLDYVETVVKRLKELEIIQLNTLTVRQFNTSDQLFSQFRLLTRSNLAYPLKGVIFIPENVPYRLATSLLWYSKPSIVFKMVNHKLYLRDKLFEDIKRYDLTDNGLVEYIWDKNSRRLKLLEHRDDLLDSNTEEEWNILWNYYFNPKLSLEVMRGNTWQLLDSYKTKVLITLLERAQGKILDLTGWTDKEYLIELSKSKVEVYEPDTTKHPTYTALDITVVTKLDKQYNTIIIGDITANNLDLLNLPWVSSGEQILGFLLYNKIAVQHLFNPLLGNGLYLEDIILNGTKLRLEKDYLIIANDKIRLVELDDLIIKYNAKVEKYSLDINQLLTNYESLMASLYHYGWLELNKGKLFNVNEEIYQEVTI